MRDLHDFYFILLFLLFFLLISHKIVFWMWICAWASSHTLPWSIHFPGSARFFVCNAQLCEMGSSHLYFTSGFSISESFWLLVISPDLVCSTEFLCALLCMRVYSLLFSLSLSLLIFALYSHTCFKMVTTVVKNIFSANILSSTGIEGPIEELYKLIKITVVSHFRPSTP